MDRHLPQDILGHILAEIPDLTSLAKATQVSKNIYGAYDAHARGIAQAVARNQFGSDIHLARWLAQGHMFSKEHPGVPIPEPKLTHPPDGPIKGEELQRLSRNAWAVRQLENFFSQRFKDRGSTTSQLDASESQRLVRALYALWLIIDIFASRWDALPVPPLTAAEIHAREALHTQQRDFTFALLPDEAARRDMVNAFTFITKDVTSWIGVCCCNSVIHADILFIFPRVGLDFYKLAHVLHFAGKRAYTPYTSFGHSPMYALREAFNRLFDNNAINLGAVQPAAHALAFLNDPASVFKDACSRCAKEFPLTTHDPELFDDRNWEMLNGDLPLREIARASFPGNLMENRYEEPIIAKHFEGPLCDGARTMRMMLAFGQEEPEPGKWLCRVCIKDMLSKYAMAWWIGYLKDQGRDVQSLEPCGAGYACLIQKTNIHHAEHFNHFRIPNEAA